MVAPHLNSQQPALSSVHRHGDVNHGSLFIQEVEGLLGGASNLAVTSRFLCHAKPSILPVSMTTVFLSLSQSWSPMTPHAPWESLFLWAIITTWGPTPCLSLCLSPCSPMFTVWQSTPRFRQKRLPWHIPGSPLHTQQPYIAQLLEMISTSYLAHNYSNPPLAAESI